MTEQATMEETKHDKFVRMRDARMPKAVHAVELLSNLSSHHYEFTAEEARALVDELDATVAGVALAFGIAHRADQAAGVNGSPKTQAQAAEATETSEDDAEAAPARPRKSTGPKPFPEDLSKAEADELHRIGAEHDRAINAIRDGKGQEAIRILIGLTTA